MSLAWSCTCWTSSSSDWALTMKPQSQFTCFAIFLRWAVRRKFLIRWLDSLEEFGQPGFTRAGPLESGCFYGPFFHLFSWRDYRFLLNASNLNFRQIRIRTSDVLI